MKRTAALLALAALAATGLASCVSSPPSSRTEAPPASVDLGTYNPGNVAATELCTLIVHSHLAVTEVDGEKVPWFRAPSALAEQTVRLASGLRVFKVNYNDGERYTLPFPVIARLEPGESYIVSYGFSAGRVIVSMVARSSGQNAVLDTAALRGESQEGLLPTFIKYVLSPTSDESRKTVRLAGDGMSLTFMPDLAFSLDEGTGGDVVVGRRGFTMDFAMKEGTVYLLVTELDAMSSKDFLDKSDYENTADYVLTPIAASADKVSFRFTKPERLAGREVTLAIEVVE